MAVLTVNIFIFSQSNDDRFVNKVFFIGNEELNNSSLFNQVELKPSNILLFSKPTFDRRLLKLDAISLKNYYNSEGFLEVSVKDSFAISPVSRNGVNVFFIIDEGKRYILNKVKFNGLESIKEKKLMSILGLKENSPYNPVQINTNLQLVDEEFQEIGKLNVSFDIKQDIVDSVNILINIDEGSDVYINKTWVSGMEKIDSSYIKNEYVFEKGLLFKKSLMDKTKRKLLQTGFFSSINLVAHPSNVDSLVNIEIRVREFQNRGSQEIDFGYSDIEAVPGINSLIGVGGSIRWTDRMILGTKNRFDATGSVVMPTEEGFVYPRFNSDMKFYNHRPFNLRLPTQIKIFYQQFKTYENEDGPYVRRFGLQYSNIFRWNRQRSFLDLGLRFELFNQPESFNDLDQIEQRKFKIHLHQDNRDNPIYPGNGNVFVLKIDAYGGPLGGNRTYTKYDIDLRQYLSPIKDFTIAGRINVGTILGWKDEYDSNEKILYEKFYLGGSNSLRAWKPLRFLEDENYLPVGKEAKVLTNWELRFPLFWKLGAVIFYDGGFIDNKLSKIKESDLEWNRGIGITFNLPFGPVRIEYGESLENKSINQFQFGFLYSF